VTAHTDDLDALRQVATEWRSAWLAGDTDAIMALYADEAVLMPQDQPPVVGREAIRSLYDAVLPRFDFRSHTTVMEVDAAGDLGYIWSSYALTATPKAGGRPVKSAGKSVFIVRRQAGGAWKITRLIDNSDGASTDQEP
jgi:uncharacterized protein (TIGR02246 family)